MSQEHAQSEALKTHMGQFDSIIREFHISHEDSNTDIHSIVTTLQSVKEGSIKRMRRSQ